MWVGLVAVAGGMEGDGALAVTYPDGVVVCMKSPLNKSLFEDVDGSTSLGGDATLAGGLQSTS